MTEVEHFIISELERRHIRYEVARNFIHVSCPYHEHSGQKLKLGFSRRSGGMHCWVCKRKGHWNEYAERFGLEGFSHKDPRLHDFEALRDEFENLDHKNEPTTPDWLSVWPHERWRGIDRALLMSIPSYEWYDDASHGHRILWPVFMFGRFRGCTSARADARDVEVWPKTRNLGGLDATRCLFPFDHPLVRSSAAVCLVEGQFDALRLLHHGIPALSVFGCGAWHRRKLGMLAAAGIERLVLAFDGDLAGEELTDAVKRDADDGFDVRSIDFPDANDAERARGIDALDPGNCGDAYLRVMRRLTRSLPCQ
jgi:hypothetical protein